MNRIPCPAGTKATVSELTVALQAGAALIDVREPSEYAAGHVPDARLMPMGQLPGRVRELDSREPVYVICAPGNRNSAMTASSPVPDSGPTTSPGGTSPWAKQGTG